MAQSDIKKFLFDQNNFDKSAMQSAEEMVPTFSEAEMEAAKHQAYAEGLRKGHADEQASRAQFIAQQVQILTDRLTTLIEAEKAREKIFEQEAVHVSAASFSSAFPVLNAKFGIDNLIAIIRQTLRDVEGLGQITIEVPIEDLEDIRSALATPLRQLGDSLALSGLPGLSAGSCAIKWKDGGVVRDANALAKTITLQLRDTLAALPQTLQDG